MEEVPKMKYSSFRRVGIFLLDSLMAITTFFVVMFTLGNILLTHLGKDEVNIINEKFEAICIRDDIPYLTDDMYGLSQIDSDTIVKQDLDNGVDPANGYDRYNKINHDVTVELTNDLAYKEAFTSFYAKMMITSIISMFISLFILQFLVPLLTKKHQTFSMLLFGACLVNKDYELLSNTQVLLRFIFMFLAEYLVIFIGFNFVGLVLMAIFNILMMIVTPSRSALHDLMFKVKMTAHFNAKLAE